MNSKANRITINNYSNATITQRSPVCNNIKQRKAADPHTGEAATRECLIFLLDK